MEEAVSAAAEESTSANAPAVLDDRSPTSSSVDRHAAFGIAHSNDSRSSSSAMDADVEKGVAVEGEAGDANVVDFNGPNDPEMAVNWSKGKKWQVQNCPHCHCEDVTNACCCRTCVALLSSITFITPLASSMFAPGVSEVLSDFDSNNQLLGGFVVSVYVLGYAAGPLVIAPLSELYGRSPVYHVGNLLFIIFTIACAVSSNLNMLIGFRFLEGVAGSTPVTIGGGTIADLFVQEERGRAMSIWSMGPLLGPVVGPIAGGFLAQAEGWRWVFWVITIAVSILRTTLHCQLN